MSISTADFTALAAALKPFSGRQAVEPEEMVVAVAVVCAERNHLFKPTLFFEAAGFPDLELPA